MTFNHPLFSNETASRAVADQLNPWKVSPASLWMLPFEWSRGNKRDLPIRDGKDTSLGVRASLPSSESPRRCPDSDAGDLHD